jgi:hypothetical protein
MSCPVGHKEVLNLFRIITDEEPLTLDQPDLKQTRLMFFGRLNELSELRRLVKDHISGF